MWVWTGLGLKIINYCIYLDRGWNLIPNSSSEKWGLPNKCAPSKNVLWIGHLYQLLLGEQTKFHCFYSNFTCCMVHMILLLMFQQLIFGQVMWSHELFKYCVKFMGGCIWEGRYKDASIQILILCTYRLNINLMLIKHAENDLKLKVVEGISRRKLLFS